MKLTEQPDENSTTQTAQKLVQINEPNDSFQDFEINAMNTSSTNRSGDGSLNGSLEGFSSRNSSHNSSFNSRPNYRNNNSYSNNSDCSHNRQGYNRDNNRNRGYQQNPRYDQRNQNFQNRYDNNQDRNRFDNRRLPNKYQHYRNQPRAQIIFKYTDQNLLEMMQTRDQFKTNKLTTHKEYNNKVNESDIDSSSLDQVQQLTNEDTDLVFNALVAADYIDKIECADGNNHYNA